MKGVTWRNVLKLYRYLTGPDDASFCHRVSAARRTDSGKLRQPRVQMRTGLAAAVMSFIFAYFAPAPAADPTDPWLIADVAVAKATITLLQSRDFAAVRDRMHPTVGAVSDDVLRRMAGVIAGDAKSVETISSKRRFNRDTGNGESQTILEYQIDSRWIVADVVIITENDIKRVSGLYFSVNSQPLRELGVFHLSGKGFVQYAFLASWIGIIGLTGCAMVLAFHRHSGWWRWALMIAMPLGLGPTVAMNWNNAAFLILGGPGKNNGVSFYPILSGRFPMVWFEMFGGTEMGAPFLYLSAPLIAFGYLIWRGVDSIAAGQAK